MRITNQQAYETYQQIQDIKKLERRHEALQVEERRIHDQIKANDAARTEYNRRMGRNGQNVDVLA
jgi:hypothetical protein